MPQKVYDRPGQSNDSDDESRPSGGAEDGEGSLSPKESSDFDQIAAGMRDAEANPTSHDGNKSANDGKNSPKKPDENEIIFSDDDKKPKGLRARITKKKATIGSAITVSIATAVVAGIVSGPGLIINQVSDIINGKIGAVSMNDSRRYRRKNFHKITDRFSRDGRRGGPIIAEMERVGYEFKFDDVDNNQIRGIRRPGSQQYAFGTNLGDELDGFMEKRHPFRYARWKSKGIDPWHTRYKVPRTSVVTAKDGPGKPVLDPEAEFNRRYLAAIDGVDNDLSLNSRRIIPQDATDAEADDIRKANQAADDLTKNRGFFDDLKIYVEKGGSVEDYPDRQVVAAFNEASSGAGEGILQSSIDLSNGKSLAGKVGGFAKGIGFSGEFADKLCIVKKRLQLAITAARVYRQVTLIRYGLAFVTASDGIKKGEANAGLIRELTKRVISPDSAGRYIGESAGFNLALNGRFSKSRNDLTRSGVAVDGKLSGVPKSIQDKTNVPDEVCDVAQDPFFQVGSAVFEIGLAVISFGGTKAATTAARKAATEVAEIGIKNSIKKAIKNRIVRQIGQSVALNVAAELSFSAIMSYTQIYAEKTLSTDFLGQEAGLTGGDIITAGAGAATKQRGLHGGQVPVTPEQYEVSYNNNLAFKEEELRQQSLFARMFDKNNLDSLAFSTMTQVAVNMNNPTTASSAIQNSILNSPRNFASTLIGIGGGKSYAAELDPDLIAYDTYTTSGNNKDIKLATDHAGNLLTIMPEDILNIDPIANVESLIAQEFIDPIDEQPIGDFAEHVKNCVESVDTITVIEYGDRSSSREDCLAELPVTKQFKAHLAYLDMLDGLEAEFIPEEIGTGGLIINNTTQINTGASAKYIPDCSVNSGNAAIACTAIDELLGIKYSATRRAAPTVPDPVPFLDCSAFTGMAIYRTYGTDLKGLASTYHLNNENFQRLSDIRDILPGDLIGKGTKPSGVTGGTGHIAIVVSYDRKTGKLTTAETDSSKNLSRIVTTKGLQVDGSGNYIWAVRYTGPKGSPQ